ncbi:hypothetical protein [Clostridium botulinum]|uniref:hypothetical protein n=1 Tax=Clostridium botulinum TaxID=1491 RepID=UPI00069B00F0|nr:hypothetical protein [Clostridium botulinum]KOA94037.1 hypothetical protein ADU76_04300 [Clostridium botulinum]KOC32894.1 hypothetical protein ADU81_10785 [Clostridium botulinum]MCD3202306.1 hypothetical protein [Clostridium botulinum C/D]MCD3223677.1 hypothetical protein [Clostridium botulinum C/D]MCD3230399.1 hypothetical protein [Clostridium botulinum C/D]
MTLAETIEFDYINTETKKLFNDFDCGHEGINNFLFQKAEEFDKLGFGVTHLAIDTNKNKIVGFYTLRNSSLLYNLNSNNTIQNFGIRGMPSVEIYMFAVDVHYHSVKYNNKYNTSDFLMLNVISNMDYVTEYSESKFLILNSVEKAINFYIRNKFLPFDKNFMKYINDDKSINIDIPHPMYRKLI